MSYRPCSTGHLVSVLQVTDSSAFPFCEISHLPKTNKWGVPLACVFTITHGNALCVNYADLITVSAISGKIFFLLPKNGLGIRL